MAFLRRFHTDLLGKDTVTGDTSVLGGATVRVLRGGGVFKVADATLDDGTTSITVYHPGLIRVGDNCRVWTSAAGIDTVWTIAVTAITYNSTDNDWDLSVTITGSGSAVAVSTGDRLVLTSGSGTATLYNDETGQESLANPLTSDSTTGNVDFYAKEPFVDLEISKSGSTTRYVLGVHGEGARDPVRPQDFGAAGDGSTNDTVALQAAIHYVGDLLGGGEVFIPNAAGSVYRITDELPLYSNMTIRGEGPGSHINQITSSKDVFAASSITRTTVTRLGLTTLSGHAFDLDGSCGDMTISENTALAITGTFVDIAAGNQNRILNNNLYQVADGVTFSGAVNDSIVTGNTISTCTGTTVTLGASTARNIVALNVLNDGTIPSDSGTNNIVAMNTGNQTNALNSDVNPALWTFGQIKGTIESLTAVASLTVASGTTTVFLGAGSGTTITDISGCADGRFLVVTAHSDSGIIVTLAHNDTGTGTDNEIWCPDEKDIVLATGDSVLLQGVTATFNGASATMWMVVGQTKSSSTGEMYLSSSGAGTTIAGTPAKETSGTATAGGANTADWTVTTTSGGRLTYDVTLAGNKTRRFLCMLSAGVTSGATDTLSAYIAIDGSVVASSKVTIDSVSGTVYTISAQCIQTIAQGSYVEAYFAAGTSGTVIHGSGSLVVTAVD